MCHKKSTTPDPIVGRTVRDGCGKATGILIDRNYFEIPAAEIDDIRVLQTWVGGKLVYEVEATE